MFKIFGTDIGMSHPFEKNKLWSMSLITISCLCSGLVLCMCVIGSICDAWGQTQGPVPGEYCTTKLLLQPSPWPVCTQNLLTPAWLYHSILHIPGSFALVSLIGEKQITQLLHMLECFYPKSMFFQLKKKKESKYQNMSSSNLGEKERKKSQPGCHNLGSDGWLRCKRNNQKPEYPIA